MFLSGISKRAHAAAIALFATLCMAAIAQAQENPERGAHMSDQLASFGGAMHATAIACGDYSEAKLMESKQQQQKLLAQQGMDQAHFERLYSAGMKEAEAKWQKLSKAETKSRCKDIKRQAAGMAR